MVSAKWKRTLIAAFSPTPFLGHEFANHSHGVSISLKVSSLDEALAIRLPAYRSQMGEADSLSKMTCHFAQLVIATARKSPGAKGDPIRLFRRLCEEELEIR